jgi:hypothetical protein
LPKPLLILKGTPDKSCLRQTLNELAITAAVATRPFLPCKKRSQTVLALLFYY